MHRFLGGALKITNDYFAKYPAISDLLDDNPGIVDAVHHDLEPALKEVAIQGKRGAQYKFTSDTILRIALCQIIEGCSLRQIIVRIDDSHFLRRFVRIFNGPMIDFTAFCKRVYEKGEDSYQPSAIGYQPRREARCRCSSTVAKRVRTAKRPGHRRFWLTADS